jgi:hypothetical protein
MYPVHDVDTLLLLAISLSSKRRPAQLNEIVAAYELIQGATFSEEKISESFGRLANFGLISEIEGGFALSEEAQQHITGQPKKVDTQERVFSIKANLSAYNPKGEHAAITVTTEQLAAAMRSHLAGKTQTVKNLFVPRPKPEVDTKRPGRRKPLPSRRR